MSGWRWAWLSALPLLACGPENEPANPQPAPPEGGASAPPQRQEQPLLEGGPGRRQAVAGHPGMRVVAGLRFHSAPDAPHRLHVDFVFPQRGQWILESANPAQPGRVLEWRYGQRAWHLFAGAPEVSEYGAGERERVQRRFDLRQAVYLWPHGFEWTEADAQTRVASLAHGRLVAELDPESGRPLNLSSEDADGQLEERYFVRAWSAGEGAPHPQTLELHARVGEGLQAVWTEELERLEFGVRLTEEYFLPSSLRTRSSAHGVAESQRVQRPARTARRLQLAPSPLAWEVALEEARRLRVQEAARLAPLGVGLSEALVFELDAQGLPVALELRLEADAPSLPSGYREEPAVEAWSLRLGPGMVPDAAWIRSLGRSAGSEGAAAGERVWGRLLGEEPEARIQLILEPGA